MSAKKSILENLKDNRLNYFLLPFFTTAFLVRIIAEAKNSDLIHAQWLPIGILSLPAKYLFRKPLVVTLHGDGVKKINQRIVNFSLKRFDHVTTGHEELFGIAVPSCKEKLSLIRNVIDFEGLRFAKKINSSKKMVLFVGRLSDMKQPLLFIKGASLVLKKRQDVIFYVLGEGPLGVPAKNESKRLGIENNVVFTGRVGNVFDYLASATMFSAASHIENAFSVAVIEALLSKVPCIITRAGTTENFFTDKKDCLLVEKKNPKEFADAVLKLLDDKKMAKRIGENGENLAKRLGFEKKQIVSKVLKVYKNVGVE